MKRMNHIEKKLHSIGFSKLQEKEDFIYFEKSVAQNKTDFEQTYIIFDKKKGKLKTVDTFMIKNGEISMGEKDKKLSSFVTKLLSS